MAASKPTGGKLDLPRSQNVSRDILLNGLDFLRRAAASLETTPKYSAIDFCTGLELVLKARLASEHWSLVVSQIDRLDARKFVDGDFHSVTMDAALDRLAGSCGDAFSSEEKGGLRRCAAAPEPRGPFLRSSAWEEALAGCP